MWQPGWIRMRESLAWDQDRPWPKIAVGKWKGSLNELTGTFYNAVDLLSGGWGCGLWWRRTPGLKSAPGGFLRSSLTGSTSQRLGLRELYGTFSVLSNNWLRSLPLERPGDCVNKADRRHKEKRFVFCPVWIVLYRVRRVTSSRMRVAHDQAMLLDSKQIKRRWARSPPFRTSAR